MNVCAEKNQFRWWENRHFIYFYRFLAFNDRRIYLQCKAFNDVCVFCVKENASLREGNLISQTNHDGFEYWRYVFPDGHIHGYQSTVQLSRPSIHFLHGNGFAVKTYRQFLLPFFPDYNLVLQDAAGHGESSVGKRFIGWNATAERFAESLRSRLTYLSDSQLIGMGHSFGGCMTALMSVKHPTLFSRLILLDPALFSPRLLWLMRGVRLSGLTSQIPLAKRARKRRTQWESLAQVKQNFVGRGTFKGWEDACMEDYIAYSLKKDDNDHYQLICPPWMEASIFATYPKGLWRAIKKISVPTYILQGEETFDYFKESYRLAEQINPNIKVIRVVGGHCFMQERPAFVANMVKALLTH